MTSELRAQQMINDHGLVEAMIKCKKILSVVHENVELDPTEANSNLLNYWVDVMNFLLTLVA
jgi:hypothetical protein